MSELVPDLQAARQFLLALTGEENPLGCWQVFADDKDADEAIKKRLAANRTLRFNAAASWLLSQNDAGAGIYVTVNETDGKGRKRENIVGLRALFVDSDGTPMPATWALKPTIIVQRDPTHWHAYWRLRPREDLARFTLAQSQLAIALHTDPTVKDLPRVMRIPGFLHRKVPTQPLAVHLAEWNAMQYSIDQVLAAYPLADGVTLDEHGHQVDISPSPRPSSPATSSAAAKLSGELTDYQWMLEVTRKFMLEMDTAASTANARGGRDKSAFLLACKCQARGLSTADAKALVSDYLQRSGVATPDLDADRIVPSAYSQPRTDKLPVRHTRKDSPPPPSDPPPPSTADDDSDEKWPAGLDLKRLENIWVIAAKGVWPVEWSQRDKEYQPRPNKRVCDLPIWPMQAGVDVATGGTYWKLGWLTPYGETRTDWLAEQDMKSGIELVSLADGPVVKRHCENVAAYLTAARMAVTSSPAQVTTRVGWCGRGDERSWVWPLQGESQITYIGGDLQPMGELAAWRAGLEHLLHLPDDDGFQSLIVVGFAIGAAFSRVVGVRNPVIGLMHTSSTGKGSALGFALSAWCNPDLLTVPASSSAKGLQDLSHGVPDCPILLDDLQNIAERDPKQASDMLYYLANGQRRVTSTKDQRATGGERRFGAGFYASENPILQGMNTGAHYRVIELTGNMCPDVDTAKRLQRASKAYGCAAAPLAAFFNAHKPSEHKARLDAYAEALRAHPRVEDLRGDDVEQLALMRAGLEALFAAMGLQATHDNGKPKAEAVSDWLLTRLADQRRNTQDRETEALFTIVSTVLNGHWGGEPRNVIEQDRLIEYSVSMTREGLVAWRGVLGGVLGGDVARRGEVIYLQINPAAESVSRLFREFGGERRVLTAWSRRGWLKRDGRHLTVKKTHEQRSAGRVVHLTETALQLFLAD